MNTGVLTLQSAPRDPQQLMAATTGKPGILFRLGHQLQLFPDEAHEQAFLGTVPDNQVQAISTALQQWDANNGGAATATVATMAQPMPAMPAQAAQPAMPQAQPQAQPVPQTQPGMPAMPAVQAPPAAPQQPGMPAMPQQAPQQAPQGMPGMPPMPAVQPPPPAPQAPAVAPQPAMPAPQPAMTPQPGMPAMATPMMPEQPQTPAVAPPVAPQAPQPAMPAMGHPGAAPAPATGMPAMPPMPGTPAPGAPVMPMPAPAAPAASMARAPQTTSDPTNLGAVPPQAMVGSPAEVVGQILTKNVELVTAIKQAGEKNTEWFEELQEGQAQILHALSVVLKTQVYLAEQTLGTDAEALAKLVTHSGEESLAIFLQAFENEEAGDEGNG